MKRQDWLLSGAGPLLILLTWALLPTGLSEGSRLAATAAPTGVIVELVGYAFEPGAANRPIGLGRGADAAIRLHQAPIAPLAALLLPPAGDRPTWSALPARPDLTLRLLPPGSAATAAEDPPRERRPGGDKLAGGRIRETSGRPWASRRYGLARRPTLGAWRPEPVVVGCRDAVATVTPVALHRIRLRPAAGAATGPEIVWLDSAKAATATSAAAGLDLLACEDDTVWWRPRQAGEPATGRSCAGDRTGWTRARRCGLSRAPACVDLWGEVWGAAVRWPEASRELLRPWHGELRRHGLSVSMSGLEPDSIRLAIDASALFASCPAGGCEAPAVPLCTDGRPPFVDLGPVELRHQELLAIGRTRFLVRAAGGQGTEAPRRLHLLHARDPLAPSFFAAAAGHDSYHPNRRALWNVPPCDADSERLTLVVKPAAEEEDGAPPGAADLALEDRLRQQRIAAAARDHGAPHQLPAVMPATIEDRALLSICATSGQARGIGVRAVADSSRGVGLRASAQADEARLFQEARTFALGSLRRPSELMVDLDGNLLRIAPAASGRVTRRTRAGLAVYAICILLLQAVPLTLARIARRSGAGEGLAEDAVWPAALATPTLQQAAGIGIIWLLFIGASFQLFIGLHPELVGKPDYIQAFLQGALVVGALVAAAAGFTLGRGLSQRLAGAWLGAAAALLAAAGWWWWDAGQLPERLWLSALRDEATRSAGSDPTTTGGLLLIAAGLCLGAALACLAAGRLFRRRGAESGLRLAVKYPFAGFAVIAAAGLALGIVERSALAFEIAVLAGLAWYAAVYWAFVRRGRLHREDRLRRRAATLSMTSGLLALLFLAVFFVVGSDLPDRLSLAFVALGTATLWLALTITVKEKFTSLLRVVALWLIASISGIGFASFVLTDMGSVAAWLPALSTGFFLWLVRPEESANRLEEPRKAFSHLLLAVGSGLLLLAVLDVSKWIVQGLEWRVLDRPRQRFELAEDISYITAGEWITQVRWLASQQDDTLHWVPNVNSDIAIFGLAANLGFGYAIAASLLLLGIASCTALAADQALREARSATSAGAGGRLYPALHRALGLTLGMICVLLIAQWLVHLATGVVLHLPITGLAFPWISHGNTTHLLFTAAVLLPMAAITALGEDTLGTTSASPRRRQGG